MRGGSEVEGKGESESMAMVRRVRICMKKMATAEWWARIREREW